MTRPKNKFPVLSCPLAAQQSRGLTVSPTLTLVQISNLGLNSHPEFQLPSRFQDAKNPGSHRKRERWGAAQNPLAFLPPVELFHPAMGPQKRSLCLVRIGQTSSSPTSLTTSYTHQVLPMSTRSTNAHLLSSGLQVWRLATTLPEYPWRRLRGGRSAK